MPVTLLGAGSGRQAVKILYHYAAEVYAGGARGLGTLRIDSNDVTVRNLANAYAQTLGTIFTETAKPFEVEIVVAEIGETVHDDQLYRLTFDGSVGDEHGFVVCRVDLRGTGSSPGTATDELGQPIPGWTDVATVWADIRMKSGLESIKAGAPVSVVQASIRVRYRTGITAGMRVVHNLQAYNITAVMPDVGGREYVDLIAEVVN